MLDMECIYNCSDEDCYKCLKHGLKLYCGACTDFTTIEMLNKKRDSELED